MENRIKQIVITGNIGCGKSTVTKIFKEQGYEVISADEVSAEILKNNHTEVSKMFSMPPQKFDTFKKRLSNMVFQKQDKFPYNFKEQLEDFMLPKIQQEIDNQKYALSMAEKKYIIEMPTLFETRGLKKQEDMFVIMVQTDKDIRVNRVLERNKHLSIQDVLDRMRTQINPSEKVEFCDEIIWNNEGVQELYSESIKVIRIMEDGLSYKTKKNILKCQDCGSTNTQWIHNDDYCADCNSRRVW
jgi:dephospho-CoA kinase